MLSELWYFLPPGLPPSFSSSLFLISHPFSYLRPYVSPFVSPSLVISLLPNNPPSLLHSLSPCIPLQWYRKTYAMLSLRSKPPLSLHNHISLYLYFSLSLSFSLFLSLQRASDAAWLSWRSNYRTCRFKRPVRTAPRALYTPWSSRYGEWVRKQCRQSTL